MKKEKKEEVKYEVTINVVYNALAIKEANKIVTDSLERHKTACKSEAFAKKTPDESVRIIGMWGENGFYKMSHKA